MDKNINLIWNMSLICPWDCGICCVDAVNVKSEKGKVKITSEGLTKEEFIERNERLSIYDQALQARQEKGLELSLEQKIAVLDNLDGIKFKIDFSGGDPLVCSENLEVIRHGAKKYGARNISVTTTGMGLALIKPEELAQHISELDFTYDNANSNFSEVRPVGYNNQNLRKAIEFKKAGIKVRAQTPLSKSNIQTKTLHLVYENLHKAGIEKMLIMRYFPVGRGSGKTSEMPTRDEYIKAINTIKELEFKYTTPKVKLQCALRGLSRYSGKNPCDLYSGSLGITSQGMLLTSAWAIGPYGQPMDDAFVLGDLKSSSIGELLNNEKGMQYKERLNENYGHCKIFAFLNSKKNESIERIFDNADPLYK